VRSSFLSHVNRKDHLPVAATAESAASPLVHAWRLGSEDNFAGIGLCHGLVNPKFLHEKAVRYIIRCQFQPDSFPLLDRDLRRVKNESSCVNFNRARWFLCEGRRI